MKNFQLAAFADEVDTSIDKQIAAMKEEGIHYLEIRGVDGENISDITLKKAGEIRKKMNDAGLDVWSLGSPFGKIGIEEEFKPHLDKFCHGLELAEVLGAKCIRLFSFFIPDGKPAADFRNAVMERLAMFVEKANGSGLILCHENEKGIYGDIASRCLEIHQTVPELKAVFDPANFVQCGQETKEAWSMLSPYVEYMHIKDAKSDGFVVPAGEGAGNLPYLLSEYSGKILTLEPHLTVLRDLRDWSAKGKRQKLMNFDMPTAGRRLLRPSRR